MPNVSMPSGQDWEPVNVGKSASAAKAITVPKSAKEITRLKEQGKIVTEKKLGAGTNASAHSSAGISAHKLEESEDLKHDKVDLSLSKSIMQARTAKKMTQKDLATAINEKPQVIAEYESGKAIPNPQIISKIERALGCKLPRPAKKPTPKPAAGGNSSSSGPVRVGGIIASQGGPPKRR